MDEILLYLPGTLMGGRAFSLARGIRNYETVRPLMELKDQLARRGYDLRTMDQSADLKQARAAVFYEVPKPSNPYFRRCLEHRIAVFAAVFEPPSTWPDNHDPNKHNAFTRIMTFNEDLIDGKKYFRGEFTIPVKYGEKVSVPRKPFSSKKLLCSISSNKFSSYRKELYGERVRAIRFMEQNHPADFDLYGMGWDKPMVHGRWASAVKMNGAIWRFWPKSIKLRLFPSYKGSPPDKSKVLPDYRFTIAYENCITNGYVSEKILEAFLYGCVPVYLGDPGIERRIPKDCFIDKRDYPDYASLYRRLSDMEEEEHEGYLDRIERFLNSEKAYPFTIDAFVENFERLIGIRG